MPDTQRNREIVVDRKGHTRAGFTGMAALKLLAWRDAGSHEAPKGGKAVRVPESIMDRAGVR